MQSQCFAPLFESNDNMVICAPTASGKTVLMEIAIYRLFANPESTSTKRVIYLAPLKSLCAEKTTEWNTKLKQAGLSCIDIAGNDGVESISSRQLSNANIICATPEKWISLARKASNNDILSSINLALIDECHMVGSSRGAALELAVLYTRKQNLHLRIIAVSATIKNLDDVSEWLASANTIKDGTILKPAQSLIFGDEFRPTPLSKIVIGYECQYAYYRFQRNLDYKLPGIINTHCAGQSILVFCATRGSAQETCRFLMQKVSQLTAPPTRIHLTAAFTNKLLNGMYCSYFESGYEEYSSTDVLQFIGRAGRPQFGASGKAIILTEKNQVSFYRNLVTGQETLDSSSRLANLPYVKYGLERKPPPSSKYSSGLATDITKALSIAYGPIMCIRDAYAQLQDSKGVAYATAL
ncbi:ATP-dependent DNA helicase MER3 [Coemansia brasiliensis]|uniref:ATP-dependent DNA helicase MER3 n=1 Tax=Coemansia brasiliensis TaxID=2650707 RepID=A0A9W8LYW3_9FUNG|nr:ATP-dependent DNA helicase MER3 [Coemansia brasiliensis]